MRKNYQIFAVDKCINFFGKTNVHHTVLLESRHLLQLALLGSITTNVMFLL